MRSARKMRSRSAQDFKSDPRGQGPSGDPWGLSTGQLEARWPARSGRETGVETHHTVSQDEAARHCTTCGSFAGLRFDHQKVSVFSLMGTLGVAIGIAWYGETATGLTFGLTIKSSRTRISSRRKFRMSGRIANWLTHKPNFLKLSTRYPIR